MKLKKRRVAELLEQLEQIEVTPEEAKEIGIRFGEITAGNVTFDAVFSTSQFSRLHGDLSFKDGGGINLW